MAKRRPIGTMHLAYRRQGRREGGREATDTGLIVWEETGWAGLVVNTTHVPSDRHSYRSSGRFL